MAPRKGRHQGLKLDGILLVDKPPDWTSHDVVNFFRGRYRLQKVGHGGTLDPMATGLLVLLLGKGTKCSERVMEGKKVYEGTYTLGSTTDSQDAEGQVEEVRPVPQGLTLKKLEALLPRFTGEILQTPPMVSALKKDGVPLYKLARRGEVIAREPRPVTIYSYEITAVRLPQVDVRVVCSKGTYIRTLAHDFGQALGCGAHLSSLRRTASGEYSVQDAIGIEAFREMDLEEMKSRLHPLPVLSKSPSLPVYDNFSSFPAQTVVLAVGAFDGLHLGHSQVIQQARSLAVRHQAETGILRFTPHPSRVLYPASAPPLLTDEDEIQILLAENGVDFQIRLPFTNELADLEPEAFLQQLLTGIQGLKGLVVGPNWRFGKQGRGDVSLLKSWASANGIGVVIAEGLYSGEGMVSSTRIRSLIREGKLESAASLLGRPYRLSGNVNHGKKYGRDLGFPTANFFPGPERLLPPPGVYAMRVHLKGKCYPGAGYITHDPRLVEVHLLDFEGDLYGKNLKVDLIRFQRPATPISDKEVLRHRIQMDVDDIRNLLKT